MQEVTKSNDTLLLWLRVRKDAEKSASQKSSTILYG